MAVTDYTSSFEYANGKPGRYVVTTSFELDGQPFKLSHECNNPEVGRRILMEREADIIDPPARESEAA